MKPNNRSAFTLIEVLVVIGITSLLAGLILSYSSSSRDRVALHVEQAKLSQTIVKAKSLTVSTYNDPVTPCGYGVHIDYASGSYELYSYGSAGAPGLPQPCENISVIDPNLKTSITSNKLPANLAFGTSYGQAIEDILFLPPNPDTWIWRQGSNATSTSGRVPITTRNGSFSVSVSVSSAGQISF